MKHIIIDPYRDEHFISRWKLFFDEPISALEALIADVLQNGTLKGEDMQTCTNARVYEKTSDFASRCRMVVIVIPYTDNGDIKRYKVADAFLLFDATYDGYLVKPKRIEVYAKGIKARVLTELETPPYEICFFDAYAVFGTQKYEKEVLIYVEIFALTHHMAPNKAQHTYTMKFDKDSCDEFAYTGVIKSVDENYTTCFGSAVWRVDVQLGEEDTNGNAFILTFYAVNRTFLQGWHPKVGESICGKAWLVCGYRV
jgi:hypothetical protein